MFSRLSRHGYSRFLDLRQALSLAAATPRTALNTLRDSVFGLGAVDYPRKIGLFLTDACNFACPMCCLGDARESRVRATASMPFSTIEKIVEQSRGHGSAIVLMGGEPLLYEHVWDAARLISQNNLMSFMITNGLTLDKHAERMVESGLHQCLISLDGWDEDSQAQRGKVKGSFGRMMGGIKEVIRARGRRAFPILGVSTVITKVTYRNLDDILECVHAAGLRQWYLSNYMFVTPSAVAAHKLYKLQTGIGGEFIVGDKIAGDSYFNPEEVQELKRSLERVRIKATKLGMKVTYTWETNLDHYYSPRSPSKASHCALPYHRVDIQSDGRISLCWDACTLGNVNSDTIAQVWHGAERQRFRTAYEQDGILPMCFRCCGIIQDVIKFEE